MTKISDLSDGGTLQSTDELIVVRSGGNARAKMNTLPDMTVSQSPSVPSSSAQIFYNSTKGAVLRGQGSTSDVTIENDAGQTALTVSTGTQSVGISGSVLVGTTTQNYAGTDLNVGSTSDAQNGIQITTSTSGNGYVLFGDGSSSDAFRGQVRYNHGSDFLALTTAGSERVRVDSSGNVGIGTSSPGNIIEVEGASPIVEINASSGNPELQFSDGGTDEFSIMYDTGASALKIVEGGVGTHVTIADGGDVGIGTSNLVIDSLSLVASHNLSWAESTNTSYANIFRETNSAATVMASGYKHSATANKMASSVAASWGKSAVWAGHSSIRFYTDTASADAVGTDITPTERLRIDAAGNLLLNGSTTPTSSAGNLVLTNGTAPAGSVSNGVVLYAEDVSSSSELKVRDEAGNVTTLSPHNFDLIPEGPSEDMAWSYFSERDGKQINIDMLKAIRVLEKISGEKLVFES